MKHLDFHILLNSQTNPDCVSYGFDQTVGWFVFRNHKDKSILKTVDLWYQLNNNFSSSKLMIVIDDYSL